MRIVPSVPNVPSVPQIMKLMAFCLVAIFVMEGVVRFFFLGQQFQSLFSGVALEAKGNYLFYWFSKVFDGFNAIKVF